jgi:hypothetical protein
MSGAELIAAERQRQIDAEGWTPEHDAEHHDFALAWAARGYIDAATIDDELWVEYPDFHPLNWPWEREAYKPSRGADRVRDLVKAGALIAAEIDRLERSGS